MTWVVLFMFVCGTWEAWCLSFGFGGKTLQVVIDDDFPSEYQVACVLRDSDLPWADSQLGLRQSRTTLHLFEYSRAYCRGISGESSRVNQCSGFSIYVGYWIWEWVPVLGMIHVLERRLMSRGGGVWWFRGPVYESVMLLDSWVVWYWIGTRLGTTRGSRDEKFLRISSEVQSYEIDWFP